MMQGDHEKVWYRKVTVTPITRRAQVDERSQVSFQLPVPSNWELTAHLSASRTPSSQELLIGQAIKERDQVLDFSRRDFKPFQAWALDRLLSPPDA